MDTLYLLTIYPLELFYRITYIALAGLCDGYGIALLFLSMVTYCIFSPLKKLTSSVQQQESAIQAVLTPQVAKIKAESKGEERQHRINALYKRYSYHPLYALRLSFGIFLQIPFLCAAYFMLLTLPEIKSQPAFWGIVQDLGSPDALLFGTINVLPILMTVVNLMAVYLKQDFTHKQKRQGSITALFFLILLYTSPSALLIYWTGNNLLTLLETLLAPRLKRLPALFVRRKIQTYTPQLATTDLSAKQQSGTWGLSLTIFAVSSALFFPASRILYLLDSRKAQEIVQSGTAQSLLAILLTVTILCTSVLPKARGGATKKLRYAATATSLLLLAFVQLDVFQGTKQAVMVFYGVACVIFLLVQAVVLPWASLRKAAEKLYAFSGELQVYTLCSAIVLVLLFFTSPMLLFVQEPDSFGGTYHAALAGLIPYFILACMGVALIRAHCPRLLRPALSIASLFFAVTALLYSFVSFVDYGSLDFVFLSRNEELSSITARLTDAVVLTTLPLLIALVLYKIPHVCCRVAQVTLVVLVGYTASIGFVGATSGQAQQPHKGETFFSFSKTEKNVAIFFLDMFTGGHVEDIFNNHPELLPKFSGFVWYPDTLAVSEITSGSAPSLYGGYKYTPEEMDKRPDIPLIDKFSEGMADFAGIFIENGYTVTFENNEYELNHAFFEQYRQTGKLHMVSVPREQTARFLEERLPLSVDHQFLLSVSLFKIATHSLKRDIYNDGGWLTPRNSDRQIFYAMHNAMRLAELPRFSRTDATTPTLNFFYNALSHFSWHLADDSVAFVEDPYPETDNQLTKVDGILPEHLYSEEHIFRFLSNFFDWLKEQDIYDNTMIILASDHCQADSRMLNTVPGRPHALLMIKDFNSTGPFRQNPALMSSADVPYLACTAIGGCPDIPKPDTSEHRIRYHHHSFSTAKHLEYPEQAVYGKHNVSTVRGSMFKKENWSDLRQ